MASWSWRQEKRCPGPDLFSVCCGCTVTAAEKQQRGGRPEEVGGWLSSRSHFAVSVHSSELAAPVPLVQEVTQVPRQCSQTPPQCASPSPALHRGHHRAQALTQGWEQAVGPGCHLLCPQGCQALVSPCPGLLLLAPLLPRCSCSLRWAQLPGAQRPLRAACSLMGVNQKSITG